VAQGTKTHDDFGQSRFGQKIFDFQAARTVATFGGHPIQLTLKGASPQHHLWWCPVGSYG